MIYQDAWKDGRAIANGYRECEGRYSIVREFCRKLDGPFTVCDIGANMCYFGLRLTEDFPRCSVMAFEFDHFKIRADHVRKSDKTGRLLLINRKLTIADIETLGKIHHFDIVLALSILHHLPGSHEQWMQALRNLGDHLIAEFAGDDNASRVKLRNGYCIPDDAVLLGAGKSHLANAQRPIVAISTKR